MASILVPVDFSTACHNAYRFALHLADDQGLDVVLVHYYSGSIDPRARLSFGGDGTIQGSRESHLREFSYSSGGDFGENPVEPPRGVLVTYETGISLQPAAAIIARAAEEDIQLVVMATRSSRTLLDRWLGSTSTTVSEAGNSPVYLVPPHASFRPFRRIVVASKEASRAAPLFPQLETLAERYDARIDFVHVEHPGKNQPLRFDVRHRIDDGRPAEHASDVITVEDRDVSRGLMDYLDDTGADLLVVINQTRKLWQALLQATLTQDIALRARLPILILHASAERFTPSQPGRSATLRNA